MTYQPLFQQSARSAGLADEMEALLPHVYTVVAEPVVRGCEFDAVVIGPEDIFVLYPAHLGRRRMDEHRELFNSFVRAEFPDLQAPVQHLRIERDTAQVAVNVDSPQRGGISIRQAAEIIMASHHGSAATGGAHAVPMARLVQRLRQSLVDPGQPVAEPFFFRSGGRKARSLAEAVKIMDRARQDGIFHLRDGSLVRWLEAQGAASAAQAARTAMQEHGADPQAALEAFLLSTGLVERPRLVVRPATLDLGYLLAGQRRRGRLRIEKGRGRGYLYGTVRAAHGWLRISPERFKGDAQDLDVQVDSSALAIRPEAYRSTLHVASNATEEPLAVPVRFRVRGLPPLWERYLLRPLAGGVLLGAAGLGLGIVGEPATSGWFGALPVGAWGGGVALLWAILGCMLGFCQPPAWPLHYAARRRLTAVGRWLGLLALSVLLLLGSWRWLADPLGIGEPALGMVPGLLLAMSMAIVPAVMQILGGGRESVPALPVSPWLRLRSAVKLLALIMVLLVGLRYAGSAWQQYRADGTVETVQVQVEEELSSLEAQANTWIDDLTIRYYQQRRGRSTSIVPEWLQEWWRRIVY